MKHYLVYYIYTSISDTKYSLLLLVVAVVVRKSMTADIEDIRIPDFSDIKGSSWNDVSDFVLIPKETVQNAKGRLLFLLCF